MCFAYKVCICFYMVTEKTETASLKINGTALYSVFKDSYDGIWWVMKKNFGLHRKWVLVMLSHQNTSSFIQFSFPCPPENGGRSRTWKTVGLLHLRWWTIPKLSLMIIDPSYRETVFCSVGTEFIKIFLGRNSGINHQQKNQMF